MKGTICLVILYLFIPRIAWSQHVQHIRGDYRYLVPGHVALETAKITAIDKARIAALADAFGTIISQNNATLIENRNEKGDILFVSLGSSDVNGEWIADTAEPRTEISYDEGILIIHAFVEGKAREIVRSNIDVTAKLLRNGTDETFENETFVDGDNVYLYFKSPVSGYLAVYLSDASGQVYCLLPYKSNTKGHNPVASGETYLFFNEAHRRNKEEIVDQYQLTCEQPYEYNRMYILFSPNEFSKANDKKSESEVLPRCLSFEDFQKWLTKCRVRDSKMQVINKMILIKK